MTKDITHLQFKLSIMDTITKHEETKYTKLTNISLIVQSSQRWHSKTGQTKQTASLLYIKMSEKIYCEFYFTGRQCSAVNNTFGG